MASESGRKVRTDGVFLGILILAAAVSLILWKACGFSVWVIPCMILTGIGIYLIVASFGVSKTSKVGPSKSSYYFVNGTIVGTLGVLGIVYFETDVSILYLVGAFLIVVALLIIVKSLLGRD